MATYQWEYGAAGSGLHFTITFDDASGTFTVTSLEGSFDLNALWMSNGDGLSDGYQLIKADNSLNMNGANEVWEDDGSSSLEKITWDGYAKLSSTGLGAEGESKISFIADGETVVFTLADFGIDSFDPETYPVLGVRATSVNGDGSIKWVDKEPVVDEGEKNQAPTDLRLVISDSFPAATPGNHVDGAVVLATFLVTDPDDLTGHQFFLQSGNDQFDLDQNTGVLTLKAGQSIGAETFSIAVRVVDPDGAEYFETFSFQGGTNVANTLTGGDTGGDGTTEGTAVTGDDLLFGFTQGDSLTGGSGDDALFGGNSGDTINGGAGDDQLFGGNGGDTISDGTGSDLIVGGDGADLINLAGDGETDILDYNALTEAGDVVNGFNVAAPVIGGAGGDIIDLSDLLDTGSFLGMTLAQAVGGGYVQLTQSGANTQVKVDLNGGGDSFTIVATLNSVLATELADNIIVD